MFILILIFHFVLSSKVKLFYSSHGSPAGKKRGRPSKIEDKKTEIASKNIPTASVASAKNQESKPNPSQFAQYAQPATSTPSPASIPVVTEEFVQVFVNNKSVQVPLGSVIIQACAAAGIDIPRFCYHEKLAIAGNCRMCLVQVEKMPKLIASCSQPVAPGMRIQTESAEVKKAREGVMEFLLANHPLDCAICDQGGECDLQDQAMAFGSDRSRFNLETERKRAVENKDFGPLIKTSMNRCIHCTRCVRFGNEVAGLPELGTTGRGNDMQIGTYVQSMLGSELSANIIDLCPVGALTSKPYEFAARPWELRKTESIDAMDSVGSAIRVDTRGVELMRIQPRTNDTINEEWLSDKSRFVSDALKTQRLTVPIVDGKEVMWSSALGSAAEIIRSPDQEGKSKSESDCCVIAGPFADAETLVAARDLIGRNNLFIAPSLYDNVEIDSIERIELPSERISQFRSNLTLSQMESIDTLLLVGCNLRHEAPLLNARIRKAFLKREKFSAAVIGCDADAQLNFDFDWLGGDASSLKKLKESPFWEKLCKSERPAFMISTALISDHPDASVILENIQNIAKELAKINPNFISENWNGMCWVPRSASHVASRLIGYNRIATKAALSKYKTLLLIGSPDTIRTDQQKIIYVGHHADRLAPISHVILPSAAYTEKEATFINVEGRVQRTRAALESPGKSRADWSILRALSEFVDAKNPLPYDSLEELRSKRFKEIDGLSDGTGLIRPCKPESVVKHLNSKSDTARGQLNVPFKTVNIPDFYLTDVISRSSATMAKCSLAFTDGGMAKTSREVDAKFNEILNG